MILCKVKIINAFDSEKNMKHSIPCLEFKSQVNFIVWYNLLALRWYYFTTARTSTLPGILDQHMCWRGRPSLLNILGNECSVKSEPPNVVEGKWECHIIESCANVTLAIIFIMVFSEVMLYTPTYFVALTEQGKQLSSTNVACAS